MNEKNVTPPSVVEVKEYVDINCGKKVYRMGPVNLDGLTTTQQEFYVGAGMIMTQKGPTPFNFKFPEGSTLKECFEKFNEIAQQELINAQKEEKNEDSELPTTKVRGLQASLR